MIPILVGAWALLASGFGHQDPAVPAGGFDPNRHVELIGLVDDDINLGPVGQQLGENYGITPLTEKQVLGDTFVAWANQFGPDSNETIRVAVIVPSTVPLSRIDTYIPRIARQIAVFKKLRYLKKIYICLPSTKNDKTAQVYYAPLARQAAREAGVYSIDLGEAPTPAESIAAAVADPRIEKKDWKLVEADSEETDEGPAIAAFDGNPDTYWHTRYDPTVAKYPHHLTVDMGKSESINGFRYVPRQDGGANGRVKGYEFYVSTDGVNWGEPIAKGTLPNVNKGTRVPFDHAVTARYFRFVALSEQSGGPWATAAEIDVLRSHP